MPCKSFDRQQLSSVPLSCAIMGGFSGDPVFTSLFYHMFDKSALFVDIQKCLSFSLFAVVFACDVFSSLMLPPFYSLSPGSADFQSACLRVAVLSIHFKFNLMMFCLPFCQRLPLTEAAGSDVW